MARPRLRRIVVWSAVAGLASIAALAIATSLLLRGSALSARVSRELSSQLGLDTTIEQLSFSFLPRPRVSGQRLTLRVPNRPDLPPFVTIASFYVDVGLLSAIRRHANTVHAAGVVIAVPPSEGRAAIVAATSGSSDLGRTDSAVKRADIVIDHFITRDAQLTFVRRDPQRTPLSFAIHELQVDDVGFDLKMPYRASLTNPVPKGLVEATGTIGPWNRADATQLPVAGHYTFSEADLGTINGIGGTLASTGTFKGVLTAIEATGTSTIPDFSLDLGGKPVPLSASFDVEVDGTDGTTTLKRVDAQLLGTHMSVSGVIENMDGPGRHKVDLRVQVADGRIEDLLKLAVDTPKPIMTGDIDLAATLSLPPGKARVRNRLLVSGRFGLDASRFTDKAVQEKMQELSRRSQGKDDDDPMARVMTKLHGQFSLAAGVLTLPSLSFAVPGADVALAGTYRLADETLDFRGTLRMQATVSKAVGGFKSIFLKPFDPIFRKHGAGAELPIKITGPRDQPKFGIEVGRVLKRSFTASSMGSDRFAS